MGRCYIQHTYSIQSMVFRKKYRTMERKKRSKGSVWEFCYGEKKSGSLKKKWKRNGRNGSHFAHTHTHSAKLVVRIIKVDQNSEWWRYSFDLRLPCPHSDEPPACFRSNFRHFRLHVLDIWGQMSCFISPRLLWNVSRLRRSLRINLNRSIPWRGNDNSVFRRR